MTDYLNVAELRSWADQLLAQSVNPNASGEERERLIKMHRAVLRLADEAGWLEGKRTNGEATI